MKNRSLLIGTSVILVIVIAVLLKFSSFSSLLRGDLGGGSSGAEGRVIACADINPTDGVLTVKEMRKFLLKLFRDVITNKAGCDPNGDGVTSKPDVPVAIAALRSFLSAQCGDGARGITEYCDDGNTTNGDGCTAQCTVEDDYTCDKATPNHCSKFPMCGNDVLEPGIPDADQPDGTLWEEQCDDGATCEGGSRNGEHCTTDATPEAALGCPGEDAHCVPQSFDGCQTNCLEETCGNGAWELRGRDGKPGKAGVDDDQNGTIDDDSERWASSSDDEDCDTGGSCEFASGHPKNDYQYSCDNGTEADKCRQDGGTCSAQTRNGCTNMCKRDLRYSFAVTNSSPDPDNTAVPVGKNKTVAQFTVTPENPSNDDYSPYQVRMAKFLFTVKATNVSIRSASIIMYSALAGSLDVRCDPLDASNKPITALTTTGTFYALCTLDSDSAFALLKAGTTKQLGISMEIINDRMSPSANSTLQVSLDNLSTTKTFVAPDKSGVMWKGVNGPQVWEEFNLGKAHPNDVPSTLYGSTGGGSQVCGDGIITGSEVCDDKNTFDGDGCSSACAVEDGYTCEYKDMMCPPGTLFGGEGGCTGGRSYCTPNNGSVAGGIGGGMDGNGGDLGGAGGTTGGTGGTSVCGNMMVEPPEECDNGPNNGQPCDATFNGSCTYCSDDCQNVPLGGGDVCGNGIISGIEKCDDSNLDNGDGCSMVCAIEADFRCSGSPSSCQSYRDFVFALADVSPQDGTISETEVLNLTFDTIDAPNKSYDARFDIDNDGFVTSSDVSAILTWLDIIAPQS